MAKKPIWLAAGGTGGHLFPAEALARILHTKGYPVDLATDVRALPFATHFPARRIHVFAAATPHQASYKHQIHALYQLAKGTFQALWAMVWHRPACVMGFGGYPSAPALLAALLLRIPIFLHEQNAVLGRANAFFARWAKGIATGFPSLAHMPEYLHGRLEHTGNPVRRSVLQAAQHPYPIRLPQDPFHLLVLGGSQGARVMAEVVPQAISLLPPSDRARVHLVQQVRPQDEEKVRAYYAHMSFEAHISPFFEDLPQKMAQAHMVIARAGASTVTELMTIGRPALLIPLPGSLDHDQTMNAKPLADIGLAYVWEETYFTPSALASYLLHAMQDPEELHKRASVPHSLTFKDAAERLAEWIEHALIKQKGYTREA